MSGIFKVAASVAKYMIPPDPLWTLNDSYRPGRYTLRFRRLTVTCWPGEPDRRRPQSRPLEPQLVNLVAEGILHNGIREQVEHYAAPRLNEEGINWVID